jgi:uncharacterized NAD-dependent epimerase/dehydratase family protein
MDETAARAELDFLSRMHKVPAVDPVRFGVEELVDRMLE